MPEAAKESGDEKLAELFARFDGRMVSPGGAAALLGLSRKTIYTLCKQRKLRAFRSDELAAGTTPRWVYIPLVDVRDYALRVGRPIERLADLPDEHLTG
jgi:hypothetical protein